jgi:CDP-diacylglycerol--glycerol-3-phosphate 3-phosphatidyltransferase
VRPLGIGWPNLISLFRIALVPVLVALLLANTNETRYLAALVFLVAAGTDVLDGYLARRNQQVTAVGAWLDPVSDKLLVIAPMLLLAWRGDFPWIGAAIIVGREVAVSGLRYYLDRRGVPMPASNLAKAKTVSQILAITLYILPGVSDAVRVTVLSVSVALTLYSGVQYFLRAPTLARTER